MLEFRPHHFLCTVGFEGKGYSEDFVSGYARIVADLRDDTPIRVTGETDSICAPCPNRRGAACATETRIQSLDRAHADTLAISPGQAITWAEAKRRIVERMSDEAFDAACEPCAWKPMGMCKRALERLREESDRSDESAPSSERARSRIPALALLASLAIAAPWVSTPPARAAIVREGEDDALTRRRPLELARSEIAKKHKSKPARALKKAWEALQAKKYPEAATLARPLANDPLFGDFGNWILASASYQKGVKAIEGKRASEAQAAADAAIAAAYKIEQRNPYSPMLKQVPRDVGLAEVMLGDAAALGKKWKSAQRSFELGFQRLSLAGALGLVRPESLGRYALACKSDKTEMCEAWIQRFTFFYPRNSEEMRAILRAMPEAIDRPKPATTGKFTQNYKSPDLDLTSFEQNLTQYLDGKFGASIKGFQQFIDEYPKSSYRFRARYWLAQAMTHQQQHEKAQTAYESLQTDSPLTYYGLLAAFASGHDMNAPIEATMPLVTTRDALLQPAELLRVERAEKLIAEGAYDLATMELKEVKARDALASPFLMYLAALASEARAYNAAFGILSDLIARNYDGTKTAAFLQMVFPLTHLDEIRKQAASFELDPILVLSLIKQESAFDKGAISSSGALGLMQLMPATASDTDPSVQRADLLEPAVNVRVGTKYLKQLLARFKGNIVLALAGYNAGPNAADRWYRESGGKRGMLEFIESIPYKETREYVSSIVRNYYWYSRKLNPGEPAKTLAHFWTTYDATVAPAAPAATPSATPQPEPTATPTDEI